MGRNLRIYKTKIGCARIVRSKANLAYLAKLEMKKGRILLTMQESLRSKYSGALESYRTYCEMLDEGRFE